MGTKKKKITLEVHEDTFAWLEVLVVGLAREEFKDDQEGYENKLNEISTKDGNSFRPGVNKLMSELAYLVETGIKRPGSWERGVLESFTGYEGTYVPAMFDKCIHEEAKQRDFKI